ncbi:LPXTG cell wall anchor domain-containing protein, partial [Marinactinospora thermotolerans]
NPGGGDNGGGNPGGGDNGGGNDPAPSPDPAPGTGGDNGAGDGKVSGNQPAADSGDDKGASDDDASGKDKEKEDKELPVTGADPSALMLAGATAAGLGLVTVYAARRRPARQ